MSLTPPVALTTATVMVLALFTLAYTVNTPAEYFDATGRRKRTWLWLAVLAVFTAPWSAPVPLWFLARVLPPLRAEHRANAIDDPRIDPTARRRRRWRP